MLLSWLKLKKKNPSPQLWWEFVHERLSPGARLWVLTATSSENWSKVRSRIVLASRSRCAYTRLSSDFMFGHIILSFTCGAGSRFDFISNGRYRNRGSTLSLSARASISLFSLQCQVHGARNMRAKCFSLMLSTFGCACLVCFYGIKKRNHERGQVVHHWPGGSGLQESSRGLITQPAAGAGLSARSGQRKALYSINLRDL